MSKFASLTRRMAVVATLAFCAVAMGPGSSSAQDSGKPGIVVFAAASLKNALDSISEDYLKTRGNKVTISYAASSALAKQIEQAAPADIFISADLDWMDYLKQKALIKEGSEVRLLGNRLVLIAPATSTATLKIGENFALATALGNGRLAMADIKAVPAGKYGKSALEKLGVWPAVEGKIAQAENVRAALALVANEEAPFGIVYQTDATAEPKVKIVDTFPENTHAPIVYPLGITAAAQNPSAAAAFVSYLRSSAAEASFVKHGFTVLKETATVTGGN